MSGRGGLGRGRGRSRGDGKSKNAALTPELAAKLKDEGRPSAPGQFEDGSSDQEPGSPSKGSTVNASLSAGSKDSSQAKGEQDQCLSSEIKKAAKNVQVVAPDAPLQSHVQDTSAMHSKQLPQAVGPGTFLSNGYPSPPGRSSSVPSSGVTMSKLNPHSTEFVPCPGSSSLNVSAAEFVPRFGSMASSSNTTNNGPQQASFEMLTASDILSGFERKSKETSGLLTMAATMLIDATRFPATFDTHLELLSELVRRKKVHDDVQEDLAEMLLTWGINESGLRYTSIKMCDYFCKLPTKDVFMVKLFTKLQQRYVNTKNADHSDPNSLMDLSLFIAEMFYRVRIGEAEKQAPVWILASAVFELIFILLELKQDQTLICVCNILKLCGVILDQMPRLSNFNFNPEEKMELVLASMRILTVEKGISERTSCVLISVLEKRAMKWGQADKFPSSLAASGQVAEEVPVVNDSDWSDYVDEEGDVIEGTDDDLEITLEDQLDPEIDEEMLREYEEFVQEFEDHLLMQEFGLGESGQETWH